MFPDFTWNKNILLQEMVGGRGGGGAGALPAPPPLFPNFSWNLPKDLTISLRQDFFAFHHLKQIICAKEIILQNFSFVEDNQSTGVNEQMNI